MDEESIWPTRCRWGSIRAATRPIQIANQRRCTAQLRGIRRAERITRRERRRCSIAVRPGSLQLFLRRNGIIRTGRQGGRSTGGRRGVAAAENDRRRVLAIGEAMQTAALNHADIAGVDVKKHGGQRGVRSCGRSGSGSCGKALKWLQIRKKNNDTQNHFYNIHRNN